MMGRGGRAAKDHRGSQVYQAPGGYHMRTGLLLQGDTEYSKQGSWLMRQEAK